MTKKTQKLVDPSTEDFRKRLSKIDELAQVILNCHLEIERDLDIALQSGCFHPTYIYDDRPPRFVDKIKITRAFSAVYQESAVWGLVLALNKLRNEIAHGSWLQQRNGRDVR